MSEKWEVVVGGKKKKIGNGIPKPQQAPLSPSQTVQTVTSKVNGKVKKGRPKVSMDYKLKKAQEFEVPVPSNEPPFVAAKQKNKATKIPGVSKPSAPSSSKKGQDLESVLERLNSDELLGYFENLRSKGASEDVNMALVRYTADFLNSRLSQVPAPDVSQWPNDLSYPRIPTRLQDTLQKIILATVNAVSDVEQDVMGVSFSSVLASLPFLLQRGDPAWGYLLFLREIVRLDPDVVLRRSKSSAELMESYGNRREVGTACLWVSAQASLHSPSVLRIVMGQIVPFYNYKHFKGFVVSVLRALGDPEIMTTADVLVEPDEFEDFFEASFDPKRKRDFERFYPRIKELTLKNLNGQGKELFHNFLTRVSDKDFAPFSPIGHEVLDILHGCLENDPSVIGYWSEVVAQFPRESATLLNYLSKNVASLNCAKPLESQFIQSDAFALAAVKNPELLRAAKKVQTGVEQREASRRRFFSWKMATYVILLTIVGLLWLDIAENGKGSFSKSNVGKLLENYGLLDEALYVGEEVGKYGKLGYEYVGPFLRNVYEGVRPVLQAVDKQLQIYIPQVVTFMGVLSEKTVEYFNFLTEKVFVGSLSPENLRKITKEVLSVVWTNLYLLAMKLLELVGLLVATIQSYL